MEAKAVHYKLRRLKKNKGKNIKHNNEKDLTREPRRQKIGKYNNDAKCEAFGVSSS